MADGERVVVETADSLCGLAKSRLGEAGSPGMHIDEVLERLGGACPVTGPFHLAGARPGGVLEIELHRVDPMPAAGEAWTGVFGGFGALQHEGFTLQAPLEPELRRVPYRDGVAAPPGPGRPLGRAAAAAVPRHGRGRPPAGAAHVVLPVARVPRRRRPARPSAPGRPCVLPVNVDGALVAFGDAHGAQGDGEITGVAVEIEAEVELTMRARDREEAGFVALPQLDTAEAIGSLAGFQGADLSSCARAAYTDLVERLHRGHGFSRADAYQLLGQAGRLRVGNMIDPFYSVLATIERRYLDPA